MAVSGGRAERALTTFLPGPKLGEIRTGRVSSSMPQRRTPTLAPVPAEVPHLHGPRPTIRGLCCSQGRKRLQLQSGSKHPLCFVVLTLILGQTPISLSPYTMHMDPDVFPDPTKFNPDRWLVKDEEDLDPRMNRNLNPFLAGSRNCIGMQ